MHRLRIAGARRLRHVPARALLLAIVIAAAGTPRLPAQETAPRPDSARGGTRDSTIARLLAPVDVVGRSDDLVGIASTASEGSIGAADIRLRPVGREGELLEFVPGLIVTQHSGEGKANQYFVRGFNLDHGTDFHTRVEGMPVNMPTHGHGQGYTDLNFLIPELVERLEYRLGVYHAELGDFGSAGGAEFHLRRTLEHPFATVEGGANGLARLAAGASLPVGGGSLLIAGEGKAYDGPWELAEGIRKGRGVARYSWDRGVSRFSLLAMAYRNRWNATDQIPARAVAGGLITRFGHLDSTDGGHAQRYSLSGAWHRTGTSSVQRLELFAIRSDLELHSNFTYYLDDPVRGDQFHQVDRRTILGGRVTHAHRVRHLGAAHVVTVGLETRADLIADVGLHRTERRVRFATVRRDRVREVGSGLFVEAESRWRPWLRSVLGVRVDAYTFHVASDRDENSGARAAGIVSPKASIIVTPSRAAELYLSGGFGFHSNDARGATITVDPASGEPARRVDPLVRSRGAEIGVRVAPMRGLRSTVSLWALALDSELLFIGDAGATAPAAASRRRGVTLASLCRPTPQLALDATVSLARARLAGVPAGEGYIPGALERVVAAGIAWEPSRHGAFGALRLRHFGAYPLVEDNGVRASAATLLIARAGWQLASGVRLQASMLNLANARADDVAYYYTSRLPGEAADGVEDVHAHPVEPRQLRLSVSRLF